MSDETIPGELETAIEPTETPKVRRISNKNPRKSAKTQQPEPEKEIEIPTEEFDSEPSDEPETSTEPTGDTKRKNRRRRGKGKSKNGVAEEIQEPEDAISEKPTEEAPAKQERQPQQIQRPPQKQRTRLDPEKVAKNAWKIYLAEVSEEGVALIGDNDARELARRCFRLSEIFLEEEERRN